MRFGSLRLRAATGADAAAAATLLISTRMRFMPYAPSAHTEAEIRIWVATHLIPSGGVIVADFEGLPVGMMATSIVGGRSWVDQMAITPEHAGKGIGSKLLASALEALSPPVRLYTFQENAGARRFYERHGFTAIEFTDGRDNEEHCPDVLYEHLGSRHKRR